MDETTTPGIEPEKPKGYIRGIWAITIILVAAILVGGGIWYYFYKTTMQDTGNLNTVKVSPSASTSTSTSVSPSASASAETAGWKTYDSDYMTFKYPSTWKVTKDPKFPARIYEEVQLEINGVTMSLIGYDIAPYNYAVGQVSDIGADTGITEILENSDITIDGIIGKRIIAESEDGPATYYGYSALVPVSKGHFSAGFSMSRNDKSANTEITNKFNTLVTTIKIKKK